MSLHRQLLLAILVSITLAFAGSLAISLLAARASHEEQLATRNADNAEALALAMSQLPKDGATIDLQVVALFETGHYQTIKVADPHGVVLAARAAPVSDGDVPPWFARLLPLVAKPGKALISDGYRQFGTVELESVAAFASLDLYRSAQTMLLVFLVAAGGLSALAVAILGRIRIPLQTITAQAQAIVERRYLVAAPPAVPELRCVGEAMNLMVERIEIMFAEEAARLDAMRQAANFDELTGLANRAYFMNQVRAALDADAGAGAGVVLLFRLRELSAINLMAGRAPTDALIRQVAAIAAQHAATPAFAGRLNGSDFALLIPGCGDARTIAVSIDDALNGLPHPSPDVVPQGLAATAATAYFPGEDLGSLLARLDNALAAAERGQRDGAVVAAASDDPCPLASHQWHDKLQHALERRSIAFAAFEVLAGDGSLVQRECFARLRLDEDGEWLVAGRFLPQLERFKLTADFDLAVAREIAGFGEASERLALNVSAASLGVAGFGARLAAIIAAAPGLAQRLSIELSEQGVFAFADGFGDLVQRLKALGCRVGIDHYGREFSRLGELQGCGVDYLNIDASFINGLASSPANRTFLKGICSLCHHMGLAVYALGVASADDLAVLGALGFDGATGPAVGAKAR